MQESHCPAELSGRAIRSLSLSSQKLRIQLVGSVADVGGVEANGLKPVIPEWKACGANVRFTCKATLAGSFAYKPGLRIC